MCLMTYEKKEFSQQDIDRLVGEGRKVLVFEDSLYDLSKFYDYHPGGSLALDHAIGKDATDLMTAFHPEEVLSKKVPYYRLGSLMPGVKEMMSRPSASIFKTHEKSVIETYFNPVLSSSKGYRDLYYKLQEMGLFETDMSFYYQILCRQLVLWVMLPLVIVYGPNHWLNYLCGALMTATFWHQGAFVAHDAGHNGITRNLSKDSVIGLVVANCLGGVSIAWWKKSHYVHHIVTNSCEHDPDIQHVPFLAISPKFFDSLFSTYHRRVMSFDVFSKFFVSFQHWLYYPVMAFARFNLYAQSIIFLIKEKRVAHRKYEVYGLVFFWAWFGTLLSLLPSWKIRVMFLLVSHAATLFLHMQITLSHFAMSTEEFGDNEPFVSRQLRTTMDVDCPEWFDWFHGGLQFQVIHHLFPRCPRHNLRKVRPYVLEFCKKHGLKYTSYGFAKCNTVVIGSLKEVANQVSFAAFRGGEPQPVEIDLPSRPPAYT